MENKKIVNGVLLCCEVGVLLKPDHKEFDAYAIVYDKKYGYFNENDILYIEADKDSAISYAKEYVEKGVDMTYAVITDEGLWDYEAYEDSGKLVDDGDIDECEFKHDDVIYSVAKINGEIVENFIQIKKEL